MAFGALLMWGLMPAPAANADACDNLKTQHAIQLCKALERSDPNIGDQQRQANNYNPACTGDPSNDQWYDCSPPTTSAPPKPDCNAPENTFNEACVGG